MLSIIFSVIFIFINIAALPFLILAFYPSMGTGFVVWLILTLIMAALWGNSNQRAEKKKKDAEEDYYRSKMLLLEEESNELLRQQQRQQNRQPRDRG